MSRKYEIDRTIGQQRLIIKGRNTFEMIERMKVKYFAMSRAAKSGNYGYNKGYQVYVCSKDGERKVE